MEKMYTLFNRSVIRSEPVVNMMAVILFYVIVFVAISVFANQV